MASSDSGPTKQRVFREHQAEDFAKVLFGQSSATTREKVQMFIFGAADLDCPLSFYREVPLVKGQLTKIASFLDVTEATVRTYVHELTCDGAGIIGRHNGQLHINSTPPNDDEWKLLIQFRIDLETKWVDALRRSPDFLAQLTDANDEMISARSDIVKIRAELHELETANATAQDEKLITRKLAKLFQKVRTFMNYDKQFHLISVGGNPIAESFLSIMLDRLRLELPMYDRISRRIVGDEKSEVGSVFEHKKIIRALSDPTTDADSFRLLISDHVSWPRPEIS